MTTEEKFNAAVNVIRNLPKNGSYQPSNDLMLRFYAYFKQATQGPCSGRRPPFYELVNRAKYDAWKGLGDMSKARAMAKYVDELHTIVETMSYSDKVANFLEAPTSELESINMDDLELIAGDVMERVRSQPNSPLGSREASPTRLSTFVAVKNEGGGGENSDHSDDEYIDTIEYPDLKKPLMNNGIEHVSRTRTKTVPTTITTQDISQDVSRVVQSLKIEIDKLSSKVQLIEDIESSGTNNSLVRRNAGGFFNGMSYKLIGFIVLWPFLASFLVNRLNKVNRK